MKRGIIDVGGGFRDIYGAGVLDVCLEEGVGFDYAIGVSAGSANLASFLAGQQGRNYRFYTEYGFRSAYAGVGNLLRKKSYVDLDYVYGTLSGAGGECPLDYPALRDRPGEFFVVGCNALTGETVYWDKSALGQDRYDIFKASSALPVVGPPCPVDGVPCFDGGLADPVPVEKAFADGCDRVVLILTKPRDFIRQERDDLPTAHRLARHYPQAARALRLRYKKYNDGVALARQYEAEGRLLLLAPDDVCGLTTLGRSRERLDRMYEKGRRDAQAILPFLAEGRL